ncbi:MAG: hypothetical protein JNK72_09290 [Myxococcales bacterium]|nr:hypothetical protein [Myxococcales bacterium]
MGDETYDPAAVEALDYAPSRWYLTGFLAPASGARELREDPESSDTDLDDGAAESDDVTEATGGETRSAARRFFPASIGVSVLVPHDTEFLQVTVSWADYERVGAGPDAGEGERHAWRRSPRAEQVSVVIDSSLRALQSFAVPRSRGLVVEVIDRALPRNLEGEVASAPARALSVFVVNRRRDESDEIDLDRRDTVYAFQVRLRVQVDTHFVARPDLHGRDSDDADERVADLQFRDIDEYAVGHGVSTRAERRPGTRDCYLVETTWIPEASVPRVDAASPAQLGLDPRSLELDSLAESPSPEALMASLRPLVEAWRQWLAARSAPNTGHPKRDSVAQSLLGDARAAAARVAQGIECLADPVVFDCFRAMNAAIARAMRQRSPDYAPDAASPGRKPEWRPFQLAFVLLNLTAMVDPPHDDRNRVDLLYFPTGGGKTEAYLGLAAFTMLLRRRRNPGLAGAGVSVLMRYTLRLLTVDQLERATTLVCALELFRRTDPATWGPWPFEIGLWVGDAATPNHIGDAKSPSPKSAIARVKEFALSHGKSARPAPVERCPWCQEKLAITGSGDSPFSVEPYGAPTRMILRCVRKGKQPSGGPCPFSRQGATLGPGALPMCLTDQEVYRRVPAFLIATVDKFANLPWVGPSGALLGKVTHSVRDGFVPASAKTPVGDKIELPPPDLIIQDELHLISGPLGTMVGLYEAAFDALMASNGVTPKVVASTATVRRAEAQTRALFCREHTALFPPPMPDRDDLFFARTVCDDDSARRYLGVAAQGRSHKVVMLKVYLALLAAAERLWNENGGPVAGNPADPYMTLLGYFSSLRELGNARRIVEDEVTNRLRGYASRTRAGQRPDFASRSIGAVCELTSRESMTNISAAKAALASAHWSKSLEAEHPPVDVALATNMISVGLDITRLGLMVVTGQPKATAEYIQTTSRVGRDPKRPGLVVTLLNIHRPRDRSHYERFGVYHASFYRAVEATSVTPFSSRALDRGVAGVTVALARHLFPQLTPAKAAGAVGQVAEVANRVAAVLDTREQKHRLDESEPHAGRRARDLIDTWVKLARSFVGKGDLQYGRELEGGTAQSLLGDPLQHHEAPFNRFTARRSLRDVEPKANVWVKTLEWDHSLEQPTPDAADEGSEP